MLDRPRVAALFAALFLLVSSGFAADREYVYIVTLDGPSVGEQLANTKQAKATEPTVRRMGLDIQARQQEITPAFTETGAEVLGSVHNVLNAVFVRATPEQARQIGAISGVGGIVRSLPIRLHIDAAGEIVHMPAARSTAGGTNGAGAGIRIGIIDTGLDHTHPAFDDSGLSAPAGFPKAFPEDLPFTNNKIIAARSYVHLLNSANPELSSPDDETPRDRIGHGTAVAMIAAGRQIMSPIGTLIGAAPNAFIGNYKIFGSPDIRSFSSDAALVAAIDDAVSDGMDVLNISAGVTAQFPWDETGAVCAREDDVPCDPAAQAAQAAIDGFGVVVVAAAGNAGAAGEQAYPMLNSISSPANAPGVITVGATSNSRRFLQSVRYDSLTLDALAGTGPQLTTPLSAPAKDATAEGDQFACRAFPAGAFAGQIAVIYRGECIEEFKVDFAARAGAVGVVLINDITLPEVVPGLETLDIPTYTIGNAAGQELATQLAARAVTITLDPALRQESTLADDVVFTSSRGPNLDGEIKPEVVAPGTDIFTAAQQLDPNGSAHSSDRYVSLNGTSFAAPFVAGTAALVLQRRPLFTVNQVRSAVINTADPALFDGTELADVYAIGAGLLDARDALDTQAVVEPATLGFGPLNGLGLPQQRSLLLRNLTTQARTFTLEVIPAVGSPSVAVQVDGLSTVNFQMASSEERTIAVTLTGAVPAPGIYEGVIRITNNVSAPQLTVPYAFSVGDGVPFNTLAIAGDGLVGTVNEPHPELLIFKAVDQYGQPIANAPVEFFVSDGGGSIFAAEGSTHAYGGAAADVDLGPDVGFQDFGAAIGDLTIAFLNEARPKPTIGGIVNGAGFASGPVAPGSIVSVFGTNLAEFIGAASAVPLPIALKHVSFSFDFPETGLSKPAAFFFTSSGQLNIQVPWEFQGHNFAVVKARIGDSVSNTFVLDLRDAAPGVFDFDFNGQKLAVATHADGSVITSDNPAKPNETIIVYGTGFGPVETPQATGAAAPSVGVVRTNAVPLATIDGLSTSVVFSGLAPGFVGLNQINVRVPASASPGPRILRFTIGGAASNEVVIWVQ